MRWKVLQLWKLGWAPLNLSMGYWSCVPYLNYNSECQALQKTNRHSLAQQPWHWTLAEQCTRCFHLHAWLLQLTAVKYTNMHKAFWVRTGGPPAEPPMCGGKSVCASHLIKTWGREIERVGARAGRTQERCARFTQRDSWAIRGVKRYGWEPRGWVWYS